MTERLRNFLTEQNHKRFARKNPERKLQKLESSQEVMGEDIISGIKKTESLVKDYPQIKLDMQEIHEDLEFLRPSAFANPVEAVNSEHDIRHNATVYAVSRILARVVKARQESLPENERFSIDEDALRIAAPRHDIYRLMPDGLESIPPFNKIHGRAAGRMIKKDEDLGSKFDKESIDSASVAASYHDYHHTPEEVKNPTLELLVDADRLELIRMNYDKMWGRQPLNRIFKYRMNHYNESFFPGLIKEFVPVEKAMYLLSIEYINEEVGKAKAAGERVNPRVQIDGIIYALDRLGLLNVEDSNIDIQKKESVAA
ncbi:MAG TPA: HD domain-containing protein [Patescibacteria group bacterium]